MKKIFVTRRIPDVGIKMLTDKGYDVDVFLKDYMPSQRQLIKWLKKKPYDAVVTLLTDKVDAKFFDAAPTVKMISNYAVGFNNIDVAEAGRRGISIANTRGASSDCVAEHAIALMMALSTRLVEGDKFVRQGRFRGWSPMLLPGSDMKGATLGLVGAGAIGTEVARIASAGFKMKVIYHDVVRNENLEKNDGAIFKNSVEEVLKEADFISLHVPLMDSTFHLLNKDHFKMMKPTAFLINTSRGPVIDEMALISALKDGTIRGAGLDVFEFEPKVSYGLRKLPNVVLTPHIASSRPSARNQMSSLVAENLIEFFDGKPLTRQVK